MATSPRAAAIAELLSETDYTATDCQSDRPEYARLEGRRLTDARVASYAVELQFEGGAGPIPCMADWLDVEHTGAVRFGGRERWQPLLFRLTPSANADAQALRAAAAELNARFTGPWG